MHLSFLDGDESLFFIIGDAWRRGATPYTRYWDLKPPGLFALFALDSLIFGSDISGPKIMTMGFVLASSLALLMFGTLALRRPLVGAFAGWIFPAYALLFDALASKPEMFCTPFTTFGALAAVMALRRGRRPVVWAALSGLSYGVAFTIKQTAAIEAIFTAAFLLVHARDPRRLAAFAAAGAAPFAGFMGLFAAQGRLPELISAALLFAVQRAGGIGSDGSPLATTPVRFLGMLRPALPLVLALAWLWLNRGKGGWRSTPISVRMLCVWAVAACVEILILHATYVAYVLPLLAPMSLLAAISAGRFVSTLKPAALRRWAMAGLAAVALTYPVILFYVGDTPVAARSALARHIADIVKPKAPGQSVYVVDYEPAVYVMAGAAPLTRYPLPMHLICPFRLPVGSAEDEIRGVMSKRPTFLVVSASRKRFPCAIKARAELVLRLAGPQYQRIATLSDHQDVVEIWKASAASSSPNGR